VCARKIGCRKPKCLRGAGHVGWERDFMRSQVLGCAGLLALAAVAAPAAVPAPTKKAAPSVLKLRVAHVYDERYAWHRSYERFRDVLRARSAGTIDVEIYARQALGNERDYVSNMRKGTLDAATVSTAAIATVAPEAAFLDLMYLWRDHDHWRRALDGDVGRRMADAIRNATAKGGVPGFEVLGYWGGNEMDLVSRTRGYQTAADLLGVKIRVQDSPVQLELWKLLGAEPNTLPYESLYDALKAGTVDAAVSVPASTLNMKFYEVAPHVTDTGHAITVRPFLLSGHTWAKLSVEQRKLVQEAAREATKVDRALEAQDHDAAIAEMKSKYGVKFYSFADRDLTRAKTQPVRERVAKDLKLEDMLADIEKEWAAGQSEHSSARVPAPAKKVK
jgi:tripartite ATP-independent transporter DctP family solute receptor